MGKLVEETQKRSEGCACGTDCLPAVVNLMAFLHYGLIAIHPFEDGNGRTARLLCDLIAKRYRLRPIVVFPERKDEYFDALEGVTQTGSLAHLELFLIDCLLARPGDPKIERNLTVEAKLRAIEAQKREQISAQDAARPLRDVWKYFDRPWF